MFGVKQIDSAAQDAFRGHRSVGARAEAQETNSSQERETQLRALLLVAEELLSSHDLGSVTSKIVHFTQRLMGCDVAVLNLLDDQDSVKTLRETSGAFSERFREARTPLSAGLTGLVARQKSAYIVEDYGSDATLEHDPVGDEALHADGLVTLAAVPLLADKGVVGVLVACWRTRTKVGVDQLGLLGSIGSLAALGVANLRLTHDNMLALERLQEAHDQIQRANSELEWSSHVHARISETLVTRPDIDEWAVTLSDLLDSDVAVAHHDGALLARATRDTRAAVLTEDLVIPSEILEEVRSNRRLSRFEAEQGWIWISPATACDELLGFVLIRRET